MSSQFSETYCESYSSPGSNIRTLDDYKFSSIPSYASSMVTDSHSIHEKLDKIYNIVSSNETKTSKPIKENVEKNSKPSDNSDKETLPTDASFKKDIEALNKKMNETLNYDELYAAAELCEFMKKHEANKNVQAWRKDFVTNFTSLGGFFGYELIDSYCQRLKKKNQKKSEKLVKEFIFTCLPIMHFYSERTDKLKELAREKFNIVHFPSLSSCHFEEVFLFLKNPSPPEKNREFLISCLQLPESLLHFIAPRLIRVIGECSPFDLSVLVKRLILWGDYTMKNLIAKEQLSYFLSENQSPHLTCLSSSQYIYPENQWYLLQWLFWEGRQSTPFYKSTRMFISFRNFSALYALSKQGNDELRSRSFFVLQEMKARLSEDSLPNLWKLISAHDIINGEIIPVLKESQTAIPCKEFDDALKFIAKSCESLYQKGDHQKEFDIDYKYFEEMVEKAKNESFHHELVKAFWEKEKSTSLQSFPDMNDFIDRAELLLVELYSNHFEAKCLLETIQIAREMLNEGEEM